MNVEAKMSPKPEVVLVVVAHSDDETLGCAGTLHRHVARGDRVFGLCFTNGVGARGPEQDDSVAARRDAALAAANVIGFQWWSWGDFPDNQLDSVPLLSLVNFIEVAKQALNPTIIYTHSNADLNIDHRRVHEATLTAFRPQPHECWQEIRAFEVASSTEWGMRAFAPSLFVNITPYWSIKVQALSAYQAELRSAPHARSMEALTALSQWRGAQAGFAYGEAFEIVRARRF